MLLDFQKLLSGLLGEFVNVDMFEKFNVRKSHTVIYGTHSCRFIITGSLIFVRFRMEWFNVHIKLPYNDIFKRWWSSIGTIPSFIFSHTQVVSQLGGMATMASATAVAAATEVATTTTTTTATTKMTTTATQQDNWGKTKENSCLIFRRARLIQINLFLVSRSQFNTKN